MNQTDYCFPILGIEFDIKQLQADVLNSRLAPRVSEKDVPISTVNLTHIPGTTGEDRFYKNRHGHEKLAALGIREEHFSIMPQEVKDTYLGECLSSLMLLHLEKTGQAFCGRIQIIWINPETCHKMHKDLHTPYRYHIPVFTHPNCLWVFKEAEGVSTLHMPADGRAWAFDPVAAHHSVANMSPMRRCHVVLADGAKLCNTV